MVVRLVRVDTDVTLRRGWCAVWSVVFSSGALAVTVKGCLIVSQTLPIINQTFHIYHKCSRLETEEFISF